MLAGSQFFCKRGAADAPVRWTGEDARPSIAIPSSATSIPDTTPTLGNQRINSLIFNSCLVVQDVQQ
jgi:hypothetical protein